MGLELLSFALGDGNLNFQHRKTIVFCTDCCNSFGLSTRVTTSFQSSTTHVLVLNIKTKNCNYVVEDEHSLKHFSNTYSRNASNLVETFLAVSECQYFTKKSDYAEENEFVL